MLALGMATTDSNNDGAHSTHHVSTSFLVSGCADLLSLTWHACLEAGDGRPSCGRVATTPFLPHVAGRVLQLRPSSCLKQ